MNQSQRLQATWEENTSYFCLALVLYNYYINCGWSKHSLKRNYLSSAFVAVWRDLTGFLCLWLYFPFSFSRLISFLFLSSSPFSIPVISNTTFFFFPSSTWLNQISLKTSREPWAKAALVVISVCPEGEHCSKCLVPEKQLTPWKYRGLHQTCPPPTLLSLYLFHGCWFLCYCLLPKICKNMCKHRQRYVPTYLTSLCQTWGGVLWKISISAALSS